MEARLQAVKALALWYETLPRRAGGFPARGTIATALVVLDRLKDTYDLRLESHRASGKSQIRSASGAAVSRILARFGEKRPFLKEGGRTNRGAPGDIAGMLQSLRSCNLHLLEEGERVEVLEALQQFLTERVRDYHNRQRLRVYYDASTTTWKAVRDLLETARQSGKDAPVAQYLVGAKLKIRFPDINVENESYSTADDQLGRPGDFVIGDTVFHVTVRPTPALYEKCRENVSQGFRVYLLVPDSCVLGARQNAEATLPGKVAVESVESFVSQNIEEISAFRRDRVTDGLGRLLQVYNERVNAVETDKSLLLEIPRNLRP
ncbi:MAG: DUF4928 family protein [Ignavibacteriales bacterium]